MKIKIEINVLLNLHFFDIIVESFIMTNTHFEWIVFLLLVRVRWQVEIQERKKQKKEKYSWQ